MIYPYDTCIDKDNQDMDTEVQFDLSCPLRGHTPKSTYTHMHTFAVKNKQSFVVTVYPTLDNSRQK